MRQICPSCRNPVEVPESAAGGDFPCPSCGKPIPVPEAYSPGVYGLSTPPPPPPPTPVGPAAGWTEPAGRPLPPPGLVPPTQVQVQPGAAATGPLSDEGLRSRGLVLSPKVLPWVAPACLTVCLVLTFFSWVAASPGGYKILTQSPWEALVGGVNPTAVAVPESVGQAEAELKKLAPANWLLLFYLAGLVVAVALAWVERFVVEPNVLTLPGPLAWLPKVWPARFAILLGLSAGLLLIFWAQAAIGYGLETAVGRYAEAKYADRTAAADTAAKQQAARIEVGQEVGRFAAGGTTVRDFVGLAHLAAVLALAGRVWLTRRGNKPLPRVVVQY